MENDITLDEDLMKVVQEDEYPLIGFQSVIIGVDHAVKRGRMDKNRLVAIEELLRPYANVSGMKTALKQQRENVLPHAIDRYRDMLMRLRGEDRNMAELMYNLYFKILYSAYYDEPPPNYEDTIKKIMDIAEVVNKMLKEQKALRKLERKNGI